MRKILENDLEADYPLASGKILAALMVADSALGSCMFSEVISDYQLGIGAAFAADFGGEFQGDNLKALKGFLLAWNLPHRPHCVALPTPPRFRGPVTNERTDGGDDVYLMDERSSVWGKVSQFGTN
jgi:hypothetical protein